MTSQRMVGCVLLAALFAATAMAEEAQVGARQEMNAAIELLKTHHLNRDKVDWAAIEANAPETLRDAKTAADAYPAIRDLISRLGIRHTFLIPADAFLAMTSGTKVGDAMPPQPDMPDSRLLGPGVALLHLPWFQGDEQQSRAYVAAARTPLNRFAAQGVCRYVIDLRGNTGGNMYPMLNGVKALLGSAPYAYWVSGANAPLAWHIPNAPTQWIAGQPDLADYDEPVVPIKHARIAVLIDRRTISSGEFTAIAFEGMRNVRFFGEPTGGFVTANAPFALPDGARLMISTAWSTDRTKRPYRVAVVPDENTARGQPALDAAVRSLRAQRCK